MNTIGTGTGIGGSDSSTSSGSTDLFIRNTIYDSSQLISESSNQTINSLSFNSTVYTKDYTIASGETGGFRWMTAAELYKEEMYIVYSGSYNYGLYKMTYDRSNSGDLMTATSVTTPFDIDSDIRMIQIGDYLYFASYQTVADYQLVFYRYDGKSFTNMNTSSDLGKYLFGATIAKSSGTSSMYKVLFEITPTQSTTYSGDLCVIDYYVYCSDTTYSSPIGYIGIFSADSTGFHLKSSYSIYDNDYESSYMYKAVPYAMVDSLFVDDYTYVTFGYSNNTFKMTKNKITFTRSSSSNYTKTYTVMNTTSLWSPSSPYSTNIFINRASYPDRKSYAIVLSAPPYYSASAYNSCAWYSATIKDGELSYTTINSVSGTPYQGSSSWLSFVLDSNIPFVFERINGSKGIYAERVTANVSHSSTNSSYQFSCLLCKGDTVYCDDGILTYTYNNYKYNVNNTKCAIQNDGQYMFETNANNSPDIPSIVITNDKGVIVYCKTSIGSDGRMTGYFLSGMSVNGTKVTSSKKAIYGPSNRYQISFK